MPSGSPSVTFGMPVYNGATYVEESVRSLLEQSEPNFTLHIVDDGSTDATPAICRRLAAEDPRIVFEQHPVNRGMTRNFDFVLGGSTTPLFAWVAQDDRCDPHFLASGLRALEDPSVIGYMPAVRFDDEEGTVIMTVEAPRELGSPDPVARARAVHRGGYHAIYALYRRDALTNGPALEDIAGTDIAFTFGMALRGRYAVDPTVRSFRRMLGYRLVSDADGRPVSEKSLGASGQLYTRNPNAMVRSMLRSTRASRLPAAQKARLVMHVVGRWWIQRWRWVLWTNARTRLHRVLAERRSEALRRHS